METRKANLYIISGLGADFTVLKNLDFPLTVNVVFLDWLMPEKKETFDHYVLRMADRIDDSIPFYLLGYSFGGLIVQEIARHKAAEKVIILASIRSGIEKSALLKFGQKTRLFEYIPKRLLNPNLRVMSYALYYLFGASSAKVLNYFTVQDQAYLKWSLRQIANWNAKPLDDVIQILGDKDHVFPISNSKPDFVIQGGTHLFPVTKCKKVSAILHKVIQG